MLVGGAHEGPIEGRGSQKYRILRSGWKHEGGGQAPDGSKTVLLETKLDGDLDGYWMVVWMVMWMVLGWLFSWFRMVVGWLWSTTTDEYDDDDEDNDAIGDDDDNGDQEHPRALQEGLTKRF